MQLIKCYREGGREVFIYFQRLTVMDGMTDQHWLDLFNAMATGPAEPPITMFECATRMAPSVYEFSRDAVPV